MDTDLLLYGYWRSSAAWRVRIALELKGLAYRTQAVHLLRDGGEQHAPAYRALNPQALIPTLRDGGRTIRQSLAIVEYLEETHPSPPLLPADAAGRARVRGLAQMVACDIHPLTNLRVLQRLDGQFGAEQPARVEWMRHWIALGLEAMEHLLAGSADTGSYCHGDVPGLADACLVPQLYNARRWQLPLDAYPTLLRIDAACAELEAFRRAAAEVQPDAVPA